uniref:Ribosomal protein S10 domain-containing protein n=3 Tax=Meloidogyne TaxID=189290 RepID=A0A915P9Z3_9BILA
MAYAYKDDKNAEEPQPVDIRIILTSQNVKALEKVCEKLIHGAREEHLAVKGLIHMPTKVLCITTRKTPCGEGSKTWDHFQSNSLHDTTIPPPNQLV